MEALIWFVAGAFFHVIPPDWPGYMFWLIFAILCCAPSRTLPAHRG